MKHTTRYNCSRRVNTFIQRYQLKQRIKEIANLFYLLLIVWFVGGFLIIASQWLFSPNAQENIMDYLQYFWFVFIEITSGFDVGDDINRLNYLSFFITIIMLISGLIIGGLVSGQIIAVILSATKRAGFVPEAPNNFKFIDPVIIFGINNSVHGIIESIRDIDGGSERDIIIIDEKSDKIPILNKMIYKHVWYIQTITPQKNYLKNIFKKNISNNVDQSDINKLFKASKKSCRVIILSQSKNNNQNFMDPETIRKAMEVETFKDDIYTIIQLESSENKRYLKHKQIDEWLNISEYSTRMIAQEALRPGLTKVFNTIMGNNISEVNEMIRLSLIPKSLSNLSYIEIQKRITTNSNIDCILLGFCKYLKEEDKGKERLRNPNYYFQINPPSKKKQQYYQNKLGTMSMNFAKDTILNDDHSKDLLIYFSDKNIEFK